MNPGVKRVVITGMGVISSFGEGVEPFEENIFAGNSGIVAIENFDPEQLPAKIAGEVRGFDAEDYIDPKNARRMDRVHLFAVAASKLALEHGGLDPDEMDDAQQERAGVYVASGIGGIRTFLDQCMKLARAEMKGSNPVRKVSPFFIPNIIANMPSGLVAMETDFKGPNFGPVSACASANHALGLAYREIKYGHADMMLAGGAESSVNFLGMAGFTAMRALSTRNDEPKQASRPFDADRDGFVHGEGSGVLLFETLESARQRGAEILAEVRGFGQTSDAYHLTQPAPGGEGAARAIRLALDDAELSPEAVDYINAHGTSTPANDSTETEAIKEAFGDHARELKVSSTKSMTGHLLGAAAGIEAIATVLAIRREECPPTINLDNPDPECDLDYVPHESRPLQIDHALSNAFGFGGHNAVLALSRFRD